MKRFTCKSLWNSKRHPDPNKVKRNQHLGIKNKHQNLTNTNRFSLKILRKFMIKYNNNQRHRSTFKTNHLESKVHSLKLWKSNYHYWATLNTPLLNLMVSRLQPD